MCDSFTIKPINSTECITYAQYLGNIYTLYQVLFVFMSIVSTVPVIKLCLNFYTNYYEIHHKRYFIILSSLLALMSLTLLTQSIDPLGFNIILPYPLVIFLSNICTYFGIVLIFYIIVNLVHKINHFFTLNIFNYTILFFTITTLMFIIIVSFLQGYYDNYYWKGIKLIIMTSIIFVLTIILNIVLINILNQYINLINTNLIHGSDYIGNKQFEHIKYKIIKHLCLFNPFILIVISTQIYSAIYSFNHINNIVQPYISFDDIFYPLAQFIGIILASSFIIKKNHDTIISRHKTTELSTINSNSLEHDIYNIQLSENNNELHSPHSSYYNGIV
jgi:hypothetical protein